MSDGTPESPGGQRSFLLIEPSEYNLILLVLRRLFLCLLLLFLMGLGALAMWLDTDRRYSGFFLALVAFSGTLAVVRKGTHLQEGDNMFNDDDDSTNPYLSSPAESPKHTTSAYRQPNRVCMGPPPQFSEEDLESQGATASNYSRWPKPPPSYEVACSGPPPAYSDVVRDLIDPNAPSTSRQQTALVDVFVHEQPQNDDSELQEVVMNAPSTSGGAEATEQPENIIEERANRLLQSAASEGTAC